MANVQVQIDIGARIKEARDEAGLTQVELAAKVDQAPRTIQAWEGNDRTPRLPALKQLGLALGKPLAFFYGDGREAA